MALAERFIECIFVRDSCEIHRLTSSTPKDLTCLHKLDPFVQSRNIGIQIQIQIHTPSTPWRRSRNVWRCCSCPCSMWHLVKPFSFADALSVLKHPRRPPSPHRFPYLYLFQCLFPCLYQFQCLHQCPSLSLSP
jgi:hypothetical protein